MAMSMKFMAFMVTLFGVASFISGIIAENKKPPGGIRMKKHGVVLCKYQSDPTILYGYISIGCLAVSALFGLCSLFHPYKGKAIPRKILFRNSGFHTFFNISLLTTGVAGALLVWPTLTEKFHVTNNIHYNVHTDCPTAKTGLLGGGSFVSLDASLLWLVTLMMASNAREDYLDGGEMEDKATTEDGVIIETA